MVLLAVTDAIVRRRYADELRREDYCVDETADGLSCLGKLRSGHFALLVAELRLLWGGGDGVVEVMNFDASIPLIPAVLLNPPDGIPMFREHESRLPYATNEMIQVVKNVLKLTPDD